MDNEQQPGFTTMKQAAIPASDIASVQIILSCDPSAQNFTQFENICFENDNF